MVGNFSPKFFGNPGHNHDFFHCSHSHYSSRIFRSMERKKSAVQQRKKQLDAWKINLVVLFSLTLIKKVMLHHFHGDSGSEPL